MPSPWSKGVRKLLLVAYVLLFVEYVLHLTEEHLVQYIYHYLLGTPLSLYKLKLDYHYKRGALS